MISTDIKITKAATSKFTSIDLDNISFGTVYTDHMFLL